MKHHGIRSFVLTLATVALFLGSGLPIVAEPVVRVGEIVNDGDYFYIDLSAVSPIFEDGRAKEMALLEFDELMFCAVRCTDGSCGTEYMALDVDGNKLLANAADVVGGVPPMPIPDPAEPIKVARVDPQTGDIFLHLGNLIARADSRKLVAVANWLDRYFLIESCIEGGEECPTIATSLRWVDQALILEPPRELLIEEADIEEIDFGVFLDELAQSNPNGPTVPTGPKTPPSPQPDPEPPPVVVVTCKSVPSCESPRTCSPLAGGVDGDDSVVVITCPCSQGESRCSTSARGHSPSDIQTPQ